MIRSPVCGNLQTGLLIKVSKVTEYLILLLLLRLGQTGMPDSPQAEHLRALYPLCTSLFSYLICCGSGFSLQACSHIFLPGSTRSIRYWEQLAKHGLLLPLLSLLVFLVSLRPWHHIRHKVLLTSGPSQRDLLKQIL